MPVLTVCPFDLKQIVSTNKMINISNNLGHLSFYWSYKNSFRKVVILPELLFCEMAFQSPLFSNSTVCPFRLKQIVSIYEMINILKSHLSFYWPYENSFHKEVILPELLFSEESCLYLFEFQKWMYDAIRIVGCYFYQASYFFGIDYSTWFYQRHRLWTST